MKPVQTFLLPSEKRKILQAFVAEIPTKHWRRLCLGTNFTHSAVATHETINLSDFCAFTNYLDSKKYRDYYKILKQCETDSLDYRDFIEKYKTRLNNNALLIVDPPYTETSQKQYKQEFTHESTQQLVDLLATLKCDFIFFNADAENIKQWFNNADCECEILQTYECTVAPDSRRKDMMAYVKRKNHI